MKFEKIPGIWLTLCAAMYLLGAVVCALAAPFTFLVGYVLGGALVLLNFWVSVGRVKRAEFPNKSRVLAFLVGGFYVRLALLGITLYGFITFLHVDPVGLVTGLSVVPAGLLVMLVMIYFANRRPEEA
jgi:hypothetical protein